jgi:hypothetical protein
MLAHAHATLLAGCDFVSRHPVMTVVSRSPLARKVRNRMMANRLRELDWFLGVLLEEAAAALDGSSHDAERFGLMSNTAKKLRLVEEMAGKVSQDDARLRAIGRVAVRLRRADRCRTAPAHERDIRLAGGDPLRDPWSSGDAEPRLTPQDFQSIAGFYRNLGDRWIKEVTLACVKLDFKPSDAYLKEANVACDGI